MCYSDKIVRPTFKNLKKDGKMGQSWQIPYLLGKIRLD